MLQNGMTIGDSADTRKLLHKAISVGVLTAAEAEQLYNNDKTKVTPHR